MGKHVAHLILRVESSDSERPFILAAGIFDEGPGTLTLGHKPNVSFCEIHRSGERENFDAAEAEVLAFIKGMGWTWCERLLALGWEGP